MERENKISGDELENIIEQITDMDLDNLPIADANIFNVIGSGYYADKTNFAGKLLMEGKPTFMVRPRRFGKSLLISTIAAIAEGEINKELFKNYFICKGSFTYKNGAKKQYDWKKYPVINLDFSRISNKTPEKLEEDIKKYLYDIAKKYNVASKMSDPKGDDSIESYYSDLVAKLVELGHGYEPKIVLLIDEYDSKLVNLDWGSQQYNDCIKVLKDFFTVVKSCAGDCQLIFMTGVTRFSLTDLGSGANIFQGNDISINDVFANVAGYKEEDIRRLFKDELALICKLRESETGSKISSETVMEDIKDYYNGYKFSQKDLNVFNPSSVLSFFQTGSLEGYWYRTGDPSILLKQMRDNIERFNLVWDELRFDVTKDDIMFTKSRKALTLEALMYQTGYLTIDKYDPSTKKYFLKFPNKEVRDSLSKNIEEIILEEQEAIGKEDSQHVLTALNEENWPKLLQLFRDSCFANASYEALKDEEKSFQHILHSFLNGACHHTVGGPHMRVEEQTGCGRSDITIDDTKNNVVYIIELKKNQSAEKAIKQIEKNKYSNKYYRKKKIVHIGLNCVFNKDDYDHRNINECIIEVKRKDTNNNLNNESKKKFVSRDLDFVEGVINIEELEDKELQTNNKRSRRNA